MSKVYADIPILKKPPSETLSGDKDTEKGEFQ